MLNPCRITPAGIFCTQVLFLSVFTLSDYLIHSIVGDHDDHVQVFLEDCGKLLRRHEAVGDMLRRTLMLGVNLFPAHTMGNRQRAVGLQKSNKTRNQTLGIRKMRKGVVYNDAFKSFSNSAVSTSPQRIVISGCGNFALAISTIFGEISIPVTEATPRAR